ncbi:MAG: cob(I)yrinic acid a,c-diamide adenosyltransferase [Proteobacteria bacterium]|nr:cob(I)yrinic acid a,c-diamide adenosyltransferase [Pseudomonadota bacterium]
MVQLTRIYTKGGDKGKTSLGSGARVSKTHPRLEVIGCVDEVNATIGLILAHLEDNEDAKEALLQIQHDLFDLGADLCVPEDTQTPSLRLSGTQVTRLEEEIDALNAKLLPLNSFVLPGGTRSSAFAHLARTTTRRAERALCAFFEQDAAAQGIHTQALPYLNRLSDYLFVVSRTLNDQGARDVLWEPGRGQK